MTPTSETGAPESRYPPARGAELLQRSGFTLVELLMTVAIMGLAGAAVVLTMPDPRPPVGAEAERFAARLVRAREEAVLANRPVAVEATGAGYAFSTFDGVRWSPLNDGPFGEEAWRAGTAVSPADERAVFDPTGAADPVEWTLDRDGRRVRIVVDGAGEVRVDG